MKREKTVRALFFLVGLVIQTLGISLTLISNFGAGGWDLVNVGLSSHFGLTIGTWLNIVAVILITVSGIMNKRFPQYTCIITCFVQGIFIDMWMAVLPKMHGDVFLNKFLVFMVGIIVISIGVSIYILAKFPVGSLDHFMLSIQEFFHIPVGAAKMLMEGLGVVLALLLGQKIGIGTVIVIFCIGPIIQVMLKYTTRLYDNLIKQD